MSLEESKTKCSACGAYLFEDDDVVCCPVCGAPHHRDCYNSIGHCALEEKHGTEEQYDRSREAESIPGPQKTVEHPNTKICGMCGAEYDSSLISCPNCNTPDSAHLGRFGVGFDYLGGVPADTDLGDGVTANEAKQFVFVNTPRYIPKFAAMKLGKKSSFNWLAFLFPCEWFLSRKMYTGGIITGVLDVAFTLLMMPYNNKLSEFGDISDVTQMVNTVNENMKNIGKPVLFLALAGFLLLMIMSVICGMFGDYFYRNHCVSTIKTIKKESDDIAEDFRKKGGVNIFMFVVGFIAMDIAKTFLAYFIFR